MAQTLELDTIVVQPTFHRELCTVDLRVSIPALRRFGNGPASECTFHLSVADLRRPAGWWLLPSKIGVPEVASRRTPFTKTLRGIPFTGHYLGVLISVCLPDHTEAEWFRKVYRSWDGAEVRDCRRCREREASRAS